MKHWHRLKNTIFELQDFCDFKMAVKTGNWTSCCTILAWFQIKLALRFRSILKSLLWFQTKIHSTQFNYHYACGVLARLPLRGWIQNVREWFKSEEVTLINVCSNLLAHRTCVLGHSLLIRMLTGPTGSKPLIEDENLHFSCLKRFSWLNIRENWKENIEIFSFNVKSTIDLLASLIGFF